MQHSPNHDGSSSDPELEAAELEVRRAEAAFSAKLQDASEAGRDVALRVASAAKPVLIGAAALLSFGLIVLAVRSVRRPRVWRLRLQQPQRSLFSEVARATLISIAATVARRAGERLLLPADSEQPGPLRQIASPHPATPPPIDPAF